MHWLAMITMLLDHVGLVFFPQELSWRIVGRIAFPIYAYLLYLGYRHTRSPSGYMRRLLWIAVISQVPYTAGLGIYAPNVVFTLLFSLLVLYALPKLKHWSAQMIFVLISGLIMEWLRMDYGMYGLLLVLIYRYLPGYTLIAGHLGLNVLYAGTVGSWLQHFSLLSTVLIACFQQTPSVFRLQAPRWLWRSFYPLHLSIIALIRWTAEGTAPY
ncbi:TraX family protein [Paenibacillus sp. JX-17]|uniref:TraX family protein n=1 Tax=Paenibacillus lacisoli TaxID=3064525 RepID=A0ABT9C9I6_9BACL|nr:TraX family protein [Paenibacillus sp. JX-17]MDO7905925.1 TraX family protein [Paenibacillus sp. JX-17]